MSINIYLDLVENPIKRWLINFCDINEDDFDFIGEEYCLLFPETINNVKKCIMVYLDLVHPPFDDLNIPIKNSKYLDQIIKGIMHHVKRFYASSARLAIDTGVKGCELLKNTTLGYYKPDLTFAPYPINKDFVLNNKKLYSDCDSSLCEHSDSEQDELKIMRNIINDYTKNKVRIGINVEILDNVVPPSCIVKDLLYNYQSSSSESD